MIISRKRSLVKALTFRIIATITTFLLIYIITGNLGLSSAIGLLDLIIKLILYYFHERAWNKVSWGMKTVEPALQEN